MSSSLARPEVAYKFVLKYSKITAVPSMWRGSQILIVYIFSSLTFYIVLHSSKSFHLCEIKFRRFSGKCKQKHAIHSNAFTYFVNPSCCRHFRIQCWIRNFGTYKENSGYGKGGYDYYPANELAPSKIQTNGCCTLPLNRIVLDKEQGGTSIGWEESN